MNKLLALLMLLAAGPATAQEGAERLVQASLAGFEVGHSASNGMISIEERVPAGETVHQWTRMVTTQRFAGVASRLPPDQLLQRMAAMLTQGCPGGVASEVRALQIAGRAAAEYRADCPLVASTGRPETFFARAIAGSSDIHMVQVAFRRVPTAEDEAFARSHLNSAVLCGADQREPACKAN